MPIFEYGDLKIMYNIMCSSQLPAHLLPLPLVLVQGMQGVKEDWFGLESELSKTRNVLVFDNRGMGETNVTNGPYTVDQLANDVIALIDHVGWNRIDLMGISMGGMISQLIAIKRPSLVNKLILGCTYMKSEVGRIGDPISFPTSKTISKREMATQATELGLYNEYRLENPQKFNDLVEHILLYKRPLKGFLSQLSAALSFDNSDGVGLIKQKTLIIHGERDRLIYLRHGVLLSQKIHGSRFVTIPQCGHYFWMTHLRLTLDYVLAFLDRESSL